VIQDENELAAAESRIDWDEYGAAHRHAEMGRQQRLSIERKKRDTIASLDADVLQARCE
jgi:hypothetical protein